MNANDLPTHLREERRPPGGTRSLEMTMPPSRFTDRLQRVRLRLGCLLSAGGALLALWLLPDLLRLIALPLAAVTLWTGLGWWRGNTAQRARIAIGLRLARLPRDFIVLNELLIPAPWGATAIDHVILSRFGVVVVGDGPASGWMMERVEAIRSLLVARGVAHGSIPMRPLVLLPPGRPVGPMVRSDSPAVKVELVSLIHLAPCTRPVLSDEQVQAIARCLMQLQQTSA